MTVAALPRIVRFLGVDYAPGCSCPHCGATGAYVHRFLVEDGRTLGAMSGCVKLFPVSRVALEEARLQRKLLDYRKRYGAQARLGRNDQRMLEAIEAFYAGARDERVVLSEIAALKRASQNARQGGAR
jgi:hypothetical protein